jgi:crossover junction endodeoxyribonuclease RuvC
LRILGIDPGSRVTGFGVIDVLAGGKLHYRDSGCIRLAAPDMAARLCELDGALRQLMDQWTPHEVGIERVFVMRNVDSALKLGQARGVALCAVGRSALPMAEYAPRLVKQTVTGTGAATKEQVQHMVRQLLSLEGRLAADAADALAIAVCHAHHRTHPVALGGPGGWG